MTLNIKNGGDIEPSTKDNILLIGQSGGGKSKLVTTLPGKTFVFMFDPAGKAAYAECPWVDFIEYSVDLMDMTPYSLKADNNTGAPLTKSNVPQAYAEYAKDFEEMWNTRAFDNYDNVVMDSATTLQEVIMDAVLHKNQRFGKQPQIDDYGPQMVTTKKTFRQLTSDKLNIRTVFILHDEYTQDDLTKKVMFIPMLTGKLKAQLPLYFNHFIRCFSKPGPKGADYFIQTTPSRDCPAIRTSYHGLDHMHDVTIKDFKSAQDYGLGKIIKEQ